MRYVATTILVSCLAVGWATAQDEPREPTSAVSSEQLGQWILELGADRFDIRDRATQALIAAGQVAIQPALKAAHGHDREVALRAVVALQEIGARGDINTLQLALDALERISTKAPSPVVARHATDARGNLMVVRQERAIEHLQRCGAVVSRELEDQWYQQAAQFPHVAIFTVEIGPQWRGTEKDLERLNWIADLEQVNFVGPQVKESWFQYLQGLPKLNSVKLKRAPITERGLSQLAQIEGLWFLRLLYVPLGDPGVPVLEKSKTLRKVAFISRELSEKGKQRLVEHFGKDNVECPRGAMLGIKADVADGQAWTVSQVIEGGAAAKAGILEKDRIIKYNGQPVPDFPTLKAFISQNEPGDTANLEIERGLETLLKHVTFGEWE